jgi:Fe2+ or Zn2+ uptake regulation protein
VSKLSAQLEQAFQAAALRPTAQRYAVLEFLAQHSVHSTAEEIFAAVNRNDPRASRATVYNNLRSLSKAGLVREVMSERGRRRALTPTCAVITTLSAGAVTQWRISPGSTCRPRPDAPHWVAAT